MPFNNCWLQDKNVERELEAFFADVDKQVSTFYENNPKTYEPHLDGHLVANLSSSHMAQLYLARIEQERERRGLRPLSLSFNITHVTQQEFHHGADIGLICRLNVAGEYALTKAALVQTKRLSPNGKGIFDEDCTYTELFRTPKTLAPQWERMLNITPACVYALYGPCRLRIRRTIHNFGTRIVPVQHIAGIAAKVGSVRFTAADAYG